MKKTRVAINGFGRIGRAFFKIAKNHNEIDIIAINELGNRKDMEYLLKYDSVYGISEHNLNGIEYLSEKDPKKLSWRKLNIDVVVEATGLFTSYEKAKVHIGAGAKKVVITAPSRDEIGGETVLMGLNEERLKTCDISSNASCTTNAGSPLMAILDETIGIEKAILNTVHAYTASQSLVDGPGKRDLREDRAAGQNIVPSSTGAAIAVTKALPSLEGKFDGISMRVPVVIGSIVDVTFIAKRNTNANEINEILKKAAKEKRWQRIFSVTEEPIVSRDIVGSPYASIADLAMTRVVDGNLVKVLAWYDNEIGYAHTLVDHVVKAGSFAKLR